MPSRSVDRFLRVAILLLVLGMSYVLYGIFHEGVVVAGDHGPGFSVQTDSGKQVSRSDFGGKVLVLNFWASWCAPCVEEIPSLDVMQRQLGPQGVVVLAVSLDKDENKYKRFLQKARVSFETTRDPQGRISSDYGTFMYPETYIMDRDGRVQQKIVGAKDWTDPALIESIRKLL